MVSPLTFVGIFVRVGVDAVTVTKVLLPIAFVFRPIWIDEDASSMPFVLHVITWDPTVQSVTHFDRIELTGVTRSSGESIGSHPVSFAVLVLSFVRVTVGKSGLTKAMPFVLLVSFALVRLEQTRDEEQ